MRTRLTISNLARGISEGVWSVTSNNKQLAGETWKYAKLTPAIARVMGAE
jgi:hypothetical protein